MATIQRSRYCKNCGRQTLHQFTTFSGGMGCLLTILTGGLFLVFLIPYKLLIEPFRNVWRCQQCGGGRIL